MVCTVTMHWHRCTVQQIISKRKTALQLHYVVIVAFTYIDSSSVFKFVLRLLVRHDNNALLKRGGNCLTLVIA